MLKLEDFKAAKKRVDEVILPTHLIHSDAFSEECGNDVYIKPENLQKTGAFKIRGAYNKIMKEKRVNCFFSWKSCTRCCLCSKKIRGQSNNLYASTYTIN